MQKEFQTSAGLKIQYWEYNPEAEKLLIMIHGFRGTHHGMLKIIESLGSGLRLIVPDLPGFGESQAFEGRHDIDDYIEFLDEFKNFIEPERPSLILGHSFGSIVVSHFAAKHPENISRMILVNPICSPALEGPNRFLTGLATKYYDIGGLLPEGVARAWLSLKPITKAMSVVMRKTNDKATRQYIDQQHFAHFSQFANSRQLIDAYQVSIHHDVLQVAKRIETPTLMIAGDSDDVAPLEAVKSVHRQIESSELVAIKNVGHLTHYETPEQVASTILKFV